MADYRIHCTNQESCNSARAHIVSVKLASGATVFADTYTVASIYNLMDQGHRFWSVAPGGGPSAWVRKWECACGRATLRSDPDNTAANNLDSLIC